MEGEPVLVISNGEDVYVYRPREDENFQRRVMNDNNLVEQLKSFLRPVSSAMNFFNVRIEGYISGQDNELWLNPEGAAKYIDRGKVAKLSRRIPGRIKTDNNEMNIKAEFKYRLSRPGTANSIICSKRESQEKASLVEEDVGLELEKEMIEEQVEAKKSPLEDSSF